jgi:pectate lyase
MKRIYGICIAGILIITGGCKGSSEPGFIEYPVNKLAVKSQDFSLHSGKREIFLYEYKTYHYAHIEWRSALDLTLDSSIPVAEFEISPESAGIKGTRIDNSIRFTMDGPGYAMVRINGDHRIFILADESQKEPDAEVVSIMDYDVDATGTELVTANLQKALDEISGTGKVLEFPEGIYRTGTISIRSFSKIYLAPGAVIVGPEDVSDLETEDQIRPRCLVLIKDAEDVEITGRGIIDANGSHIRGTYGDEGKGRLMLILNSRNVTLDGIMLRDPPSWNTHILHSEDVIIRNIKMLNDIYVSNTDGFDPDASRRVLIENCFAYCGDDNVAVKSTGTMGYLQDVADITVRNNVFLTKKSALKVGTESNADVMKNITFENNDVLEADRGMTLYCYDGAVYENIRYINNRFERTHPDRCQCGIHFRIRRRTKESRSGIMKQILIKDCSFSHAFPNLAQMTGLNDDHMIELTIENLTIEGIPCSIENEASWLESTFADITYEE